MKFMRILFHSAILAATLVIFSNPLRSDTADLNTIQVPKDLQATHSDPDPEAAGSAASTPPEQPHSSSRIIAELKTNVFGDVAILAALFLFGRAIWLLLMPMRPKVQTPLFVDDSPVEIPPLRPIPERITLF
jgi:hypothetical protein